MKITREDVLRVAELANLELTEAEIAQYGGQLESILNYCQKLNELDTANVEPMAQILEVGGSRLEIGTEGGDSINPQHLREDLPVKVTVIEDVLRGAPDPAPPYLRVPKVIDR